MNAVDSVHHLLGDLPPVLASGAQFPFSKDITYASPTIGCEESVIRSYIRRLIDEDGGEKPNDFKDQNLETNIRISMEIERDEDNTGANLSNGDKQSREEKMEDMLNSSRFLEVFCRKLPPLAVVFIAATTGQGDDPDNMKEFFKMLWSHRQNRTLLSGTKFAVIGLGDSSYQKFNYSAKRLNNLLTLLGANSAVKIGLADDQHDLGPDFVVDSWLEHFWLKMGELYPSPEGLTPIANNVLPPPRYKVTFLSNNGGKNVVTETHLPQSDSAINQFVFDPTKEVTSSNICPSMITKLERVTSSDHFQDVRLVEFDVSNILRKHKPGDVLMIQPQNTDADVKEFLDLIGIDGGKMMEINSSDLKMAVKEIAPCVLEQPCTMYQCAKKYFDIMSVPKRYFFELLSFFATDEDVKERFQEFASAEGQQDLYDYCNRPKRSIVEVLADFPDVTKSVPFEYFFDLIPMLKPRAYSIASSAAMYPGKAQILMAVVNYKTNLKRPRLGVCSNWLKTLNVGDFVNVWIKQGTLKFPTIENSIPNHTGLSHNTRDANNTTEPVLDTDSSVPPVIMIGPGTGCAPFRSYIQEQISLNLTNSPPVLFFGCRNNDKDHFFKEEWQNQSARNQLELYTAFSRDQDDKIYVQHRIRENWRRLWDLIDRRKALIFFAGNAKRVPIDVHEALTFVCESGLGNQNEAALYMKKDLEKRYQTETWA
uniref:NADPH-dependent diflavin oxidoreductase 1-like n=1 Tax=Hirondellea gigas TaxID=1518452 RepID=A0A6A7FQY1_9CRUS